MRIGPRSATHPSRIRTTSPPWVLLGLVALSLLASGWTPVVSGARPTDPGSHSSAAGTLYPVRFNESTLPTGTTWSVSIGGQVYTSNSTELQIEEPNGTYLYLASTGSNLTGGVRPLNGSFTVSGGPVSIFLGWSPAAANATPSAGMNPGSSIGEWILSWFILVVVGVAALIGIGATIARRRSKLPPLPRTEVGPPGPPQPGGTPPDPRPENDDPLSHML